MTKDTTKTRDALIVKYGSLEGYKAHMRAIASKGGKAPNPDHVGFKGMTPERLREVSIKGGSISRRIPRES